MKIINLAVSFYCYVVVILFVILFIPGVLFLALFIHPDKLDRPMKICFRFLNMMLFVRLTIKNMHRIEKGKSYLYIPNHASFFDPIIMHMTLPGYVRGIETLSHFKWPLYGAFLKCVGNIPIDRSSIRKSIKSFEQAKEYLKNGKSVILYPEGTRTDTDEVGEFKRLPFLLAKQAGADIIPCALSGTRKLLPKGSMRITPTKLLLNIGEVIPAEKVKEYSVDELKEIVKKKVVELREYP